MSELFRYHQNETKSDHALFLYHGTGGNETDLLPLVQPFIETHIIVGLRGNVQEQGMNRFFARFPDGSFDQDSIHREVEKFQTFLQTWSAQQEIQPENITHIGYSNGANFILANMLLHPDKIHAAGLLHPMLPFRPAEDLDLSQHKLFLSWSPTDQMIREPESRALIEMLRARSATLTEFVGSAGHAITREEIQALHEFLS